eukprot:CAMPEP_0185576438 /NCGR_PEP_ID=MMETSP0434-20130131/7366_1 /TAXON_ID=626734 ORGANISM="Favella taraikaensis, Strain Fe Narragansett Bay" /NCGR_SAMPLE_ID=MMETSP0434 /ASSEMBLY_ACC=CAM_ASM_000379 /LENGTH=222 /DNA_ID=CAMNT_0028193645 /DNA_START=83 /DNA_END=752 /DNA_ORIENTATION=+
MIIAGEHGFVHLKDEGALLDEDLRAEEGGGVLREAVVVGWLPARKIQVVEVVSPAQSEVSRLLVVVPDLNEVVHRVPGHVRVVESLLPGGELGSPEVHHERLGLRDQLHSWVESAVGAHFAAVDGPADVVGGPLDHIDMPVVGRVQTIHVGMGLSSPGTVAVDDVSADGVLHDRGHNLEVELIPLLRHPLGSVPVGEEGDARAWLVGSLDLGHELSVSKSFD